MAAGMTFCWLAIRLDACPLHGHRVVLSRGSQPWHEGRRWRLCPPDARLAGGVPERIRPPGIRVGDPVQALEPGAGQLTAGWRVDLARVGLGLRLAVNGGCDRLALPRRLGHFELAGSRPPRR